MTEPDCGRHGGSNGSNWPAAIVVIVALLCLTFFCTDGFGLLR